MLFLKLASYYETTAEISIAHFSDLLCLSLFIFYEKVLLVVCKFRILKFLLKLFLFELQITGIENLSILLVGFCTPTCLPIPPGYFSSPLPSFAVLASPLLWSIVFIIVWNAIKPRENYFLLIKPSAIRSRESAFCKNKQIKIRILVHTF